jgi:copper chaperone CopZ
MFNLFKKDKQGELITLKIDGMHCTSCSLSIDGELEDLDGVISATTSYAKSETKINYDPKKVTTDKIKKTIESLDYKIKI